MPELDDAALERRLRGVLQEHLGALPLDLTVDALDRRREAKGLARRSGRGRGMTLLAAAALLLVGGAWALVGSGLLRPPSVVPPVPEPTVVAVATESPDATSPSPSESATPSASPDTNDCTVPPGDPSEPPGPLAWTPASLKEDWPAYVRPEPAGDGSVQQMPLTYLDGMSDGGSKAYPCIDIRGVMADTREVHLRLDSGQQVADPTDRWTAYGVVTDDDRDGVPDWRYGTDNTPVVALTDGDSRSRWWRTNLHTDRTDWGQMLPWTTLAWEAADFKGEHPGSGSEAGFLFSGTNETAGKGLVPWGFELDMPFYTWASVIVNGRVVATDYAPDAGWLVATRGAKPGGTYLLGDPYPHLSMTVPDGWTGGEGVLSRGTCDGLRPCAVVRFEVIDGPEDLCSGAIKPPLGPSFDDLMTYFAGLPMIEISESADVTVDGLRGKHLQVRFSTRLRELADENRPGELNPALYESVVSDLGCAAGPIARLLVGMLMEEGGISAWILDVDGVHVLIVSGLDRSSPAAGDSDPRRAAEIRQIVESIHFER